MSTPRNTVPLASRRDDGVRRLRVARAARAAAALVAAALGAACADAPTTPAAPPDAAPALAPRGPLLTTSAVTSSSMTSFTYGPYSSVSVSSGRYKLVMPQGAVCDPATSGYGPGTWDTACQPLRGTVTITMRTWTYADGSSAVRFSPDLRFVPSRTVTLTLADRQAAADPRFTFVWCRSDGSACVNEGATDPAVATQRDATRGIVWARIKHFSGYNVIAE